MANITIIAAIGKNRELGKDNDLIWHLKEDMKFFKEKTMGHKIVMGFNTFNSLPMMLVDREHIVLSHRNIKNDKIRLFDNVEALDEYLSSINEEVFIIGGASMYKLFLDKADKLILTEVEAECRSADVYFPEFDRKKYYKRIIKRIKEDNLNYKFVIYKKRDEKNET